MKIFAYVLVGVMVGLGLGFLITDSEPQHFLVPQVSYAMSAPETEDVKPWTGDDLREMAQIYDQQADELQSEAVRIERQATALMLKPHMDPKGFQRTSLMHVASARWEAAKDLREMAAMHRAEGDRLVALKNP